MENLQKGIVYLGNLPHGFYEENLTKFFSQFGEISRLKVKRSDRNAKPMGYAYIEFAHKKVATVVANTMHNYLMFNKLMKCRLVKGDSNKIFRKSNLKVEFCSGTKRKRKNQNKLKNANEENVVKKAEKCKARLSKALGLKIDSRFLLEDSKKVDSGEKAEVSDSGELIKKFIPKKGKRASQDTNPVMKKKQKLEKNSNKMEDSSTSLESPNSQCKTPAKEKVQSKNICMKDTPIYMDIEDEEDDEIQLKTPPNVIKRYKKSTKIKSLKKKIFSSKWDLKSSVKDNVSTSSPKDSKQVTKTGLKKLKKSSMPAEEKGKQSNPESENKISKKKLAKKQKLQAKKCNQSTESLSGKVKGKLIKKSENLTGKRSDTSQKFKLSSKSIKKIRKPNSKSQVKLVSFKKTSL